LKKLIELAVKRVVGDWGIKGLEGKIEIRIGEEFKPSPKMKTLYYLYFILAVILGILTWFIPLILLVPLGITLFISIIILPILIVIAYWIPKYYDSIIYKFTENEIIGKRGVWFKRTGIVPYHRITNIDVVQGPIARKFGLASLRIQTAGYSRAAASEMSIDGVEHYEDLRTIIMDFVRKGREAIEEKPREEDINRKILKELMRIREILEKSYG